MQRYTKELKEQIVEEYLNGSSCKALIDKYRMCKSSLYSWISLFKVRKNRMNRTSFTYHDYLEIKKKLEIKTMEFNILRDTHFFKDSSTL